MIFLLLLFAFISPKAWSQERDSLSFNLEIGSPEIQITNPDDSIAYYDGIATDLPLV